MPSAALATAPASTVSKNYTFIPTAKLVEDLGQFGYVAVGGNQTKTRIVEKQGFQKHVIRLRHQDNNTLVKGEVIPELVVMNSHCGTSSFKLMAGLFRIVCSNGLVVSDGTLKSYTIRHSGYTLDDVSRGVQAFTNGMDQIQDFIRFAQAKILSDKEVRVFNQEALAIRHDIDELRRVKLDLFARPKRNADVGNSLWKVYNRAQEDLLNGGYFIEPLPEAKRQQSHVRKITGMDKQIEINRNLWSLALAQ